MASNLLVESKEVIIKIPQAPMWLEHSYTLEIQKIGISFFPKFVQEVSKTNTKVTFTQISPTTWNYSEEYPESLAKLLQYPDEKMLVVHISFFMKDEKLIIEFNRRSGDLFKNIYFFKQFKEFLKKNNIIFSHLFEPFSL
jgi:hypothetical protein